MIVLMWWEIGGALFCGILLYLSYVKYRVKRSKAAKYLLNMFIAFDLAAIFHVWGLIYHIYDINTEYPIPIGPDLPVMLIIALIRMYQIAYFMVLVGTYYLYAFSLEIFADDDKNIKERKRKAALGAMMAIIIFGIIKSVLPPLLSQLGELGEFLWMIDPYVIIYTFTLLITLVRHAFVLLGKVDKKHPNYSNLLYIEVMGIFFLLMITGFVLETIHDLIFSEYPNIWSFISWAFVAVAIYSAYRGFYAVSPDGTAA